MMEYRGEALIVGSESAAKDYLIPVLEEYGYHVQILRSYKQALEWIKRERFPLIVVAMDVFDEDSYEVLRAYRESYRQDEEGWDGRATKKDGILFCIMPDQKVVGYPDDKIFKAWIYSPEATLMDPVEEVFRAFVRTHHNAKNG